MAEFEESDYNGLMINVHLHKGKDLFKVYPDLNLYKEFSEPLLPPLDRNQIITFIVLCYDKESPFRKKYPDLDQRKYHAALEAEFDINEDNKFESYMEEIIQAQNPVTREMTVAYCRLHYNTKYSYLVLCESLFYTNLRTALMGEGAQKMDELKKIQDAMEAAQRELLAFDNNKELVKSLYKSVNNQRIDYSPETIAKNIKEKGYNKALPEDEY